MARLINKRDVNLYVEELVKTENHGYSPLKIIRNLKGVDTARLKIYPVTIVNLLGKYGNFETDSNGDGIADGGKYQQAVRAIPSLSTGAVYGSHSQKIVAEAGTAADHVLRFWYDVEKDRSNHIFFVSFYSKIANTQRLIFYFFVRDTKWTPTISYFEISSDSTVWVRKYKTLNIGDISTATEPLILYQYNLFDDDSVSFTADGDETAYVDGTMTIDLTEMGVLPPPLKEYFDNQVSNWEDLATTSNITAIDGRTQTGEAWLNELIPYVDSVASLGFKFS